MSGLERVDHGHHRGGLGAVALERGHGQREPGGIAQQAQRDLRIQSAFFREARFAEPIASVGFEVKRRHVIKHQTGRSQLCVDSARGRKCLPERWFGEQRKAAVQRRVRHRDHPSLLDHAQRVGLTGRLDDPRQHQLPKRLVPVGSCGEPELVVGRTQRIPQQRRLRRGDRQRLGRRTFGQAQVELSLPAANRCAAAAFSAATPASSRAEPRCSILRDPRREDHTTCTAVAPKDVFTVRTYATQAPYGPLASAQIRTSTSPNPQFTALQTCR